MTTETTNCLETTPSHEDDPRSGPDDGDTSFEIDEPDDEEIIDDVHKAISGTRGVAGSAADKSAPISNNNNVDGSTTATISTSASLSSYTVPHVSIKDDLGNQSDTSIESHTSSSTPTTADVADIAAASLSPYAQKIKGITPLQNARFTRAQSSRLGIANGSIAEDNISGSIATTTTEIDLDGTAALHAQLQHATMSSPHTSFHQSDLVLHNNERSSSPSSHKRTISSASYHSTGSQHHSQSLPSVIAVRPRAHIYIWIEWICVYFKNSGIGEPSVYHALVVIFLEFFAWGLLTMPVITVLNQTFPDHTFLMNGLVMGIKGILSFLSAPLIGALSDIWGRKFFLLITVFFTCAPIPLMTINSWWFFAMISISGVFAVTFSVVFAYVADVTTVEERSRAYGLVSATFAASLVISPALGASLMEMYSDTLVVALATAIAVLDVFFILVAVPESLPEKVRPSSWGAPISWEQADPFAALRKVGSDHTILMQCVTVLLSYLPEAGQYSCIFVYLKLKMGFNTMEVAIFIAVVGILSISVQVTLGYLMRALGAKRTIVLGLILEMMQLLWYGFGSQAWMMWAAGVLAALGSITYPAISAFVSIHSNADRQGAVQGMVTGMRGLCNGLGPAMFGVIFYLFNVDLNDEQGKVPEYDQDGNVPNQTVSNDSYTHFVPGPPFVFGAFMVVLAILVAIFIPEARGETTLTPNEKKRVSVDVQYEIERGQKTAGTLSPLMRSESLAQL